MIEASHLCKSYGPVRAVSDVSFRVERGEVVGFLGPNGAGKSTTLRMLAGFLGPTSGTVRIAGHDLAIDPLPALAALGYMPETSPLYPELRVGEYLSFRAELKRVPRKQRREAVGRALRSSPSPTSRTWSSATSPRATASAWASPTRSSPRPPSSSSTSPPPASTPTRSARCAPSSGSSARTAPSSSPRTSCPRSRPCATRALVIAGGRLVAQGSIEEIRALRRTAAVRVTLRGDVEAAAEAAGRVAGVARVAREGGAGAGAEAIVIELDGGADAGRAVEEVVGALVAAGVGVREVAPRADSLEQVFAELTAPTG